MNLDKAEKILEYYLNLIKDIHDIKGDEYHEDIVLIEEFIENNDFSFEFEDKINPITLSLKEMYNYTRISKTKDSVYKIKTDTVKLSATLIEMINSNNYNLEVIDLLKYMPYNMKKTDGVKSLMKEQIKGNKIPYNKLEEAYKMVFAFKESSKNYLLDTRFIGQYLHSYYRNNEDNIYILIAMLITQMETNDFMNSINSAQRSNITQLLKINNDDTKIEGVYKYIRKFIDIGDLFEIILKHKSPLLNDVARKLMTKSPNRLDLSNVLKNYDSIINKLGVQGDAFVEFLNEWDSQLSKNLKNKDIFSILTSVDFIIECFNNEYKISKIVINESIAYFKKMKYDYFENMFTDDLKLSSFICFYQLVKKDYLKKFTSDMILAFRSLLEKNIELNSLDGKLKYVIRKMYSQINKNSLQDGFRSIRDRLILELDVLNIDTEFYIPLIMRHSRLHEKPDKSIRKIIIPVLKTEPHLIIDGGFEDKIITIANKSESEKFHLKEMLESIDRKDLAIKIEVDDLEEYNEEAN